MPSPVKVPSWFHMLDEFARWPDQIAWYDPTGLRMSPQDQHAGVVWLLKKGLIAPAGYRLRGWIEDTYGITSEGRRHWEVYVKGRRSRPKRAPRIPRWSTAQMAVALGPRDVWDLSRVPWTCRGWVEKEEPRTYRGKKLPRY